MRVRSSWLEAKNYGFKKTETCEVKLCISISPRSGESDLIYRKELTYDSMRRFGLSQSCGVFCFHVHEQILSNDSVRDIALPG